MYYDTSGSNMFSEVMIDVIDMFRTWTNFMNSSHL